MEQDTESKSGFFTLFKNRVFYKQLFYSIIAMVLCFSLWLKYIDFYTLHDEYIVLPDFYGVHINDLNSVCQELDLRYVIIDSAFNKKIEKGTILEQDPLEKVALMGELMAYHHDGFWQCMDTRRDRDHLEELWNSGEAPWKR